MSDQSSRIREIMEAIAKGRPPSGKLIFDKRTKTIVATSKTDPDEGLIIEPGDADVFVRR